MRLSVTGRFRHLLVLGLALLLRILVRFEVLIAVRRSLKLAYAPQVLFFNLSAFWILRRVSRPLKNSYRDYYELRAGFVSLHAADAIPGVPSRPGLAFPDLGPLPNHITVLTLVSVRICIER